MNEAGYHVTVMQVEVIIWAIHISRNYTHKLTPMLLVVTCKMRESTLFGQTEKEDRSDFVICPRCLSSIYKYTATKLILSFFSL